MAQNIKSNPPKTILTITIGFLFIYLLSDAQWSLVLSLSIGSIGILSPFLSKKIEFIWFKLAWLLGLFVPKIILSVVFYLMLTPMAFLRTLISKSEPLSLKNNKSTLFQIREKSYTAKSFENPW